MVGVGVRIRVRVIPQAVLAVFLGLAKIVAKAQTKTLGLSLG